jgi:hypothetical protein
MMWTRHGWAVEMRVRAGAEAVSDAVVVMLRCRGRQEATGSGRETHGRA